MGPAIPKDLPSHPDGERDLAAVSCVIYEDNAGDWRWSLLDGRGASLATSVSYPAHHIAREAAAVIRDAPGSSWSEQRPADHSD